MKKIVMISRLFHPHIGGVEKHVLKLSEQLIKKGYQVALITQKLERDQKDYELYKGIKVYRLDVPRIKYVGLFFVWLNLIKLRNLFEKADLVQVHDVFLWYLPIRFLIPKKSVYTTFHGWEGVYPIQRKHIVFKKLAQFLSHRTMSVGKYIEKYYGVKSDVITYGGVEVEKGVFKKNNTTLYLGRLAQDTGLNKFLKGLNKKQKVIFCGNGPLAKVCGKYGKVLGFTNPIPYLKKAKVCFTSGYLSALEASVYKCEIVVGWDNKIKRDYWQMSPFCEYIRSKDWEGLYKWSSKQTWSKVCKDYEKLWLISNNYD